MKLPLYARVTGVIVLTAALFMAYPGERHLALLAGWTPIYAWAMPFLLSAYAAVTSVIAANRSGHMSSRIGALAALFLAMSAQVSAHLISAGYMATSAFLVTAVSAVPALVVVHVGHLLITPLPAAEASRVTQVANAENGAQKAAQTPSRPRTPVLPPMDSEWTADSTFAAYLGHADMSGFEADIAADRGPDTADTVRTVPDSGKPDAATIRAAIDVMSADGHDVTGQDLADHFKVSDRTGRRYLAMAAA